MKALVALAIALGILCLAGLAVIATWASIADAPWEGKGQGTGKPAAPASSWEGLSYKDQAEICQGFAADISPAGGESGTDWERYKACMDCGPKKAKLFGFAPNRVWGCP